MPSAAAVIVVLSPGDETFAKLTSSAAHGVEEIIVADPAARTLQVWQRREGEQAPHEEAGRSDLLDVSAQEPTRAIDRP